MSDPINTNDLSCPEINEIVIGYDLNGDVIDYFRVGNKGVTRIEATTKPGEYSHIPYIRVWKGDTVMAEFCQHKLAGVYFADPDARK